MEKNNIFILGAGVTGLACGYNTGFTVFEKNEYSGGICSSYYISKHKPKRQNRRSEVQEDYRFEYGGGHWIFGQNDEIINFISAIDPVKKYNRQASVYLPTVDTFIPYPIQNNLRFLPDELSQKIITEIANNEEDPSVRTMFDWCDSFFGKTLSGLFFHPFHDLYTAGLWKTIQPQDGYKSPINIAQIISGAEKDVASVGYNTSFIYPQHGLSTITSAIEKKCDIQFGKEVSSINLNNKTINFIDGSEVVYKKLITTLPLNVMQDLTGIQTKYQQDPYTSVMVLNIGAQIGDRKINDHWIYFPTSLSGFHRVGFYSNVDKDFLPLSKRNGDYVSLYVEKAFPGGNKPNNEEIQKLIQSMIDELQQFGFIGDVDVVDPTWIDVAYTWSYPDSNWKEEMLSKLLEHNIHPLGRYATWKFQGILDSLNDGLKFDSSKEF